MGTEQLPSVQPAPLPPPPTHRLKHVQLPGGRGVPVVMQSENGPCPLLAIANVLLLRGNISLPPGASEVTQVLLWPLIWCSISPASPIPLSVRNVRLQRHGIGGVALLRCCPLPVDADNGCLIGTCCAYPEAHSLHSQYLLPAICRLGWHKSVHGLQ